MKKNIIAVVLLINLGFSDGIVCPDYEFSKLSKIEQDKIIKKDFKLLHKLMKELNGIVSDIDKTRAEIKKMRGYLKNNDGACEALDLIKLDLDEFERQLSKIGNKNGVEYKKIHQKYNKEKNIYDVEILKNSCKK